MSADIPPQERVEIRAEVEQLKDLLEAAKRHLARHERKRAWMVIGEVERRKRDLDIQISYWEEQDE